MFNHSKNTRLFALITLATTFVYYRYATDRSETFNSQFPDAGSLSNVEVSQIDLSKFLQRDRDAVEHNEVTESITTKLEQKQSLNRQNQSSKQNENQDTISNVPDSDQAIQNKEELGEEILIGNESSELDSQIDQDGSEYGHFTEEEKKNDDLDIRVVNNIVYHKNDTIPKKPIKFPLLRPSGGKFLDNLRLEKFGFKNKDLRFLKQRRKTMIERAEKIERVCKSRSKLIEAKRVHMVWDRTHDPRIIYCPLYKVASTTWMINFLRLAHFNEDNPKLKGIQRKKKQKMMFKSKWGAKQHKVFDLYPPPDEEEEFMETYKNSLRVIIVRHPFTRILSAYRDKMTKLEPKPEEYHFRDLQLRIIAKYRNVDSTETSPFPTFAEFVQYIVDSTKKYVTAEDWKLNVNCWTPYWAQCNVCGVDYNVVIKLETMAEDERFLITLSNLEELKKVKAKEWRHLHNSTSSEIAPEFFNQLSKNQIKHLYQRYKLDFMLFGYQIDDIYKTEDEEDDDEYDEEDDNDDE